MFKKKPDMIKPETTFVLVIWERNSLRIPLDTLLFFQNERKVDFLSEKNLRDDPFYEEARSV